MGYKIEWNHVMGGSGIKECEHVMESMWKENRRWGYLGRTGTSKRRQREQGASGKKGGWIRTKNIDRYEWKCNNETHWFIHKNKQLKTNFSKNP